MRYWAIGSRFSPMSVATSLSSLQARLPGRSGIVALALASVTLAAALGFGGARLLAQIEGERGIAPVVVSLDIQVTGIEVNTSGKSAQEARDAGWSEARKKAWVKLGGPTMPDSQIQAMVSAIIIEREQIGPHRYIARLTVVFDRGKAGQFVGSGDTGEMTHSAPMLVLPVLYSGGVAQTYEVRGLWQAAWARFNPSTSGIDYVRPSGAGGDSLFLNAGQTGRRSRTWWAGILSQFQASDVLVPEARLERQWPGGPVHGSFSARYGPDRTLLETFTLNANSEEEVPAMLDAAVKRIDGIYNNALGQGTLRPDPTLHSQQQLDPQLAAIIAAVAKQEQDVPDPVATASGQPVPEPSSSVPLTSEARVSVIVVQFATPDARAVDTTLASVRSVPGVKGASTSSLAMGGTSVMRVSFSGSLEELRDALRSRGWSVTAGNNALSIRR